MDKSFPKCNYTSRKIYQQYITILVDSELKNEDGLHLFSTHFNNLTNLPRMEGWKWVDFFFFFFFFFLRIWGFPDGSSSKEYACYAGDTRDMSLIPRSERSPGARNGNPLQYSCLENPMDRRSWPATVHRVTKQLTKGKILKVLALESRI